MIVLVLILILALPIPVLAQTPPPSPTPIPIPASDLDQTLGDADERLQSAPDNLTGQLPNETGRQVFGYARWLLSPSTAAEVFDVLAPLIQAFGAYVTLNVVLGGVYVLIYIVIYVVKFVIWVFRLLLQIVTAIANFAGGAISWLLRFIR